MNKEPAPSPSFGTLLNAHFVYNLDSGQWAYTDGRLSEITGVLPSDPRHLLELIEPDDQLLVRNAYLDLQENRLTHPVRIRMKGRDGYHWLELSAIQLELSGTNCLIGTFYDITADMEHRAELTKYANKKNAILHMLSHDLRGPLGVARSLTRSLKDQLTDEVAFKKVEAISTMINQSIELIVDLTKRELLDTTEVALVINPVNLVESLSQYLAESHMSSRLAARNFHFEASSDRILAAVDEPKFTQVINNLIGNALKFTNPGGNIRISVDQAGEWVEVRVNDDGIGIPDELQPYVFERYSRARRDGLQGEPTEGIGLSICQSIISWHKGSISCESEEGIGTTFLIRLPAFSN